MPRPDKKKSQPYTVYLRTDSQVFADFQADVEASPISHLPGTLMAVRLGEYYDAVREGRLLPKGMTYSGVASGRSVPVASAATRREPPLMPEIDQEELDRFLNRPDVIAENGEVADDELSFFEDEEDDEEE